MTGSNSNQNGHFAIRTRNASNPRLSGHSHTIENETVVEAAQAVDRYEFRNQRSGGERRFLFRQQVSQMNGRR